jgi:hypothetical protein
MAIDMDLVGEEGKAFHASSGTARPGASTDMYQNAHQLNADYGLTQKPTAGSQMQPSAQPSPQPTQSRYAPTEVGTSSRQASSTPQQSRYAPTGAQSRYAPTQAGAQQTGYVNPTDVTQSDKSFGKDAEMFMIEPFAKPFDFQQQRAEGADYRERFTDFLEGQETPQQTRDRLANRYGYEDQQENYLRTKESAEDIMSSIRALPEQIQGRASDTIMTSSQLANIQNKEVGDLMKIYNQVGELNEKQGRRLAITEQNMNQAAQLEMAQQQKMMTPWLQEYQDKNIMQAREYSGWTFSSQLELNRLVANQQSGFNWTNAEATRAHELAMQENAFQNSLQYMDKQNELADQFWG